jgi:adenine phosphoribosyltransferase
MRLAKRIYTYRELAAATGLPAPLLSRYITGRSLPSPERAARILSGLWRLVDPRHALAMRIAETGGLVDTSIVLTDPLYLSAATTFFSSEFADRNITRILVPEASGLPLATALSISMGVPFVVARRGKHKLQGEALCSSSEPRFCVPAGSVGRHDRVLVVDDIVETGKTLRALREIVEASEAKIVGVAALVVIGEEWKAESGIDEVTALVSLTKPSAKARAPSI